MSKKEIKQYILEDFYRYYGKQTNKKTYLRYAYTYPNIAFTRNLRLAKYYQDKNILKYIWYKLRHRKLFYKYSFQIPFETNIGRGFYLAHFGNIIINQSSIIGNNVSIAQGVTIGKTNRGKKAGCPRIGDNVWIGANAVIVGNITIGNNVLIAPLSYVNVDIPSNSIVIGNPAKIIPKENATQGYIENAINI
ncbi:MAG: serine acetyltransferase [Peptostreptococcaceae bacterium]|nr:serine acetyltransferase [Peptostreptococcaceae bacterium]